LFEAFQGGDLLGLGEKPDALNFSLIYSRIQRLIHRLEAGELPDEALIEELCRHTQHGVSQLLHSVGLDSFVEHIPYLWRGHPLPPDPELIPLPL
jgi:hypothetical protein